MLQGEFKRIGCWVEHLLCFPWQNVSFSVLQFAEKEFSVT